MGFSAFQSIAFQLNAFQIGAIPSNDIIHGSNDRYTYISPSQITRDEKHAREKIRKQKTDLERLESVLAEAERKKEIAAQSKLDAMQRESLQRAIELQAIENEYLMEINRLLMVRAELIRQVKNSEAFIIILVVMRKRKLRPVLTSNLILH